MKVTRLETIHVRPRWLLVRIHTDTDITGWGEATLEGRSPTVETMIHEMGRWLIGRDPRRIEHIWQQLQCGGFYRGGPVHCSALSGIDIALWDILGRHLKAPVHQLLGGRVRDRIRIYAWAQAGTADDYVNSVRDLRTNQGLTAFKYNATDRMRPISTPAAMQKAVERLAGLRDAVGPISTSQPTFMAVSLTPTRGGSCACSRFTIPCSSRSLCCPAIQLPCGTLLSAPPCQLRPANGSSRGGNFRILSRNAQLA